jgi:F-type H+-transporting ATPase subunit a
VLAFIILAVISTSFFPVVRPTILVATERLTHDPLFTLPVIGPFYLTNTLTTLLLADLIIILLALAIRNSLRNSDLVPHGISGAAEALVEVLYNLTESTAGRWTKTIFPWFASFLIIVLISNWMGLIPGMESIGLMEKAGEEGHAAISSGALAFLTANPGEYHVVPFFRGMSTDLNFTIALALISVIATQTLGFKVQGWRYIFRYFNVTTLFSRPFFGVMDFIVGILELISTLALILSFSFRLFGNMFAGMVLLFLVANMVPVFAPSFVMTFEFFIGAIQAFVFGMLTLVFMSQATQGHGSEEHHS